MTKRKLTRLSPTLVALGIAGACTVVDKADYTFDDTPSGDGGSGDETGGRAGASGGGTAGKGGTSGTSGTSGKGGTSGEAGTTGTAGDDGAGDGGGGTGTGGSGGKGGTSGKGGTGGNDPCDPDPCDHGTCEPDGTGYNCDCDAGYEGDECDTNTDDCDPNPCQNGGTCADALNDFRCTCIDGYTGDTCTSGGPCDPNPCQHGGSCTVVRGTALCSCRQGSVGNTCQTLGPDCRAMRSGGVATTNGVYQIDPGNGTSIEVYCDMSAGGITYVELAFGFYNSAYPGYELMSVGDLQQPGTQQAFIWAYNRQGGLRNLVVGLSNTNCCFKGGTGANDYIHLGTGMYPPIVFPSDFSMTNAYNCGGPYVDTYMRFYTWASYTVATPPLPSNFFATYPASGMGTCAEGNNPGFFFKRI